jgi:hypothetical protein
MDLEDDTHMEPITAKPQEIVNVSVMISNEMLDGIAKRLAERVEAMDIKQMIDNRIEYFMNHTFDINDYTDNLDTYDIKRGIVDDVIETIKDRL